MRNEFAILVLSCDQFSDMWQPFLSQFRRYFPDTGACLYLGSNLVACNESGVVPVLSGKDIDWSRSYKRILEQIEEPKLAVITEDHLPASKVDIEYFSRTIDVLVNENAKHIKYWTLTQPDFPTNHINIGQYARGAPYRASVNGFWDRKYLMSLLINGESPWDFEIMGSYRTSYVDGFLGLTEPLFEFKNMIEKGRWIPRSVKWAKKEGVMLNLDRRPMLEGVGHVKSNLQTVHCAMMRRIPWQRRVRLMNTLRRALISY